MTNIKNFAQELYGQLNVDSRKKYRNRNYFGTNNYFDSTKAPKITININVFNKEFEIGGLDSSSQYSNLKDNLEDLASSILADSRYFELDKKVDTSCSPVKTTFKKFKSLDNDTRVNSIKQVKKASGILVSYEKSNGNEAKVVGIDYGSFARDGVLRSGFMFNPENDVLTQAEYNNKGEPYNQIIQILPDGSMYKGLIQNGQKDSLNKASNIQINIPGRFYFKGDISNASLTNVELYNQHQVSEGGNFSRGFLHGSGSKIFPDDTKIVGNWDHGIAKGDFELSLKNKIVLNTTIPETWLTANAFSKENERVNNLLPAKIDFSKNASYEGFIALDSNNIADWFRAHYKDDFLAVRDLKFVDKGKLRVGGYEFSIEWGDNGQPSKISLLNDLGSKELLLPAGLLDQYNFDPKTLSLPHMMRESFLPRLKQYDSSVAEMSMKWAEEVPNFDVTKKFYDSKTKELYNEAKRVIQTVLEVFTDPSYSTEMPDKAFGTLVRSSNRTNGFADINSYSQQQKEITVRAFCKRGDQKDRYAFISFNSGGCSLVVLDSKHGEKIPRGQGVSVRFPAGVSNLPLPPANAEEARNLKVEDFFKPESLEIFKGYIVYLAEGEGYVLKEGTLAKQDRNRVQDEVWTDGTHYNSIKARKNLSYGHQKFRELTIDSVLALGSKERSTRIHPKVSKNGPNEEKAKSHEHGPSWFDFTNNQNAEIKSIKSNFKKSILDDRLEIHRKDGKYIALPVKKGRIDFDNALIRFQDMQVYKGAVSQIVWTNIPDDQPLRMQEILVLAAHADYDPSPKGQGELSFVNDDYKITGEWLPREDWGCSIPQGLVTLQLGKNLELKANFQDKVINDPAAVLTHTTSDGAKQTAKVAFSGMNSTVLDKVYDNNILDFNEEQVESLILERMKSIPFFK